MKFTIPHSLGQHYAFALGRLGTMEQQLLVQTDIDRLLGAPTGAEAVKMLRDLAFITTPEQEESFQITLDRSVAQIKENVDHMASATQPEYMNEPNMFDVLWLTGDRALLSYALKEKYDFTSRIASKPEPPAQAGITPKVKERNTSPQEIDDSVAKAYEIEAIRLAKGSGSRLIIEYVRKEQEMEKLRHTMRTEGSNIETIVFEKEGVAQLGEILAEMRNIVLGPEALFSYAARALHQIQLLKMLLTGKVNNLPIQEIKSLLPPLI